MIVCFTNFFIVLRLVTDRMNILITGGLGQVGYYITQELLKNQIQAEITIYDNKSNNKINEDCFEHYNNVSFEEGDIRYIEKLYDTDWDIIFHTAAQVSVPFSIEKPVEDMKINIGGTLNLLELAKEKKSKIVLFSSAAAIGEPSILPIPPNHKLNPKSMYGVSKATTEFYGLNYYHHYNVSVYIARPFNIYSPLIKENDSYSGVISIFIKNALKNNPLTIFGDGNQTRDFIYAEDVAKIVTKIINYENLKGKIINIGTGKETKIIDLAKIIISLTNSSSEIIFTSPRAGDIKRSVADISDLTMLNLNQFTSIKKGITKIIDNFK